MALPITIPNTFAGSTGPIPLSQLDNNFSTVVNGINGIGNGTNSLANVSITGGSISNVSMSSVDVSFLQSGANAVTRTVQSKLRDGPSVKDFGAVGDGVTNDTVTLEAALAAASYSNVFAPTGTYVTTTAQAFLYPGRWSLSSPGIAKIGSRTMPFGDISANTTIYAGTGETFTINEAVNYLHDRRIRPNAVVTIQVANGTYTPTAVIFQHPDGSRIQLIGNTATPASCQLTFDATSNQSGIQAGPGFGIGLVNGFRVIGSGARVSRTIWNTDCYGAAVLNNGPGTMSVGANVTVESFYYGYLSDKGAAMRIAAGATSLNTGDAGFHAREGSFMLCDGCTATTSADLSTAVSLGSGAGAELGSTMSCFDFTATDCQIAGVSSQGNSAIWAAGLWSTNNILYGAVSYSGTLFLGTSPAGRVTKLNNNNIGLGVFNGGYVSVESTVVAPSQINNNTYDGISVDGARCVAYGTYVGQSGNGGYGLRVVNTGWGRFINSTIAGTSGATITDSGRNSLALLT